jgi:hypothetical protein
MRPIDIQSSGQLLGVARALESDAVSHYHDMATRMEHYGNEDAWAWFEQLERESRERVSKIQEWAELEGIELIAPGDAVIWEDPAGSTTYDAESRDPYRSSAYKALAYAGHNMDRSFNLYTNVAATTTDEQTERCADILANDALNRSRLLQTRRRRAYQNEQRGPWQQQLDAALQLRTSIELYAVAAAIERRLADLLATLAEHHEDLLHIAEHSEAAVEKCQQELSNGTVAEVAPPPPYNMENVGKDLHQDVLLIFTESERAFNFYDTVMVHARDEAIMLAAQQLSEAALTRLQAIHKVQHKHGISSDA